MMKLKLTKVQLRAYNKLKRHGGWQSSYRLQESLSTMRALVKKGLVKSKGYSWPGTFSDPQVGIEWKVVK